MTKKLLVGLFLALGLSTVLAACGAPDTTTPDAPADAPADAPPADAPAESPAESPAP